MTTAVKEEVHGLNPIPFQIERAETELSNLSGELEQAEAQRKELIRRLVPDQLCQACHDLENDPDFVQHVEGAAMLSLAVRFGSTRLIDNVLIGP